MKYEWLDGYLLSLPGAEKDYKPEWGWFRYMVRGRMFAAVCSPGPEHKTCGGHDLVNLKCGPAEAELLRTQYPEILPGFYMDKRTWIACFLDGDLPDGVLRELCAQSHRLVLGKLPKYVQREILGNEKELYHGGRARPISKDPSAPAGGHDRGVRHSDRHLQGP